MDDLPDWFDEPGKYVLAVSDLREQRLAIGLSKETKLSAAMERNQRFHKSVIGLWRFIAQTHVPLSGPFDVKLCSVCGEINNTNHFNWQRAEWPCLLLRVTADSARAYEEMSRNSVWSF